jgi:hypothetical protein
MNSKKTKKPITVAQLDLPFREGSAMHYCVRAGLAGIGEEELEQTLRSHGYRWRFHKRVLLSGNSAWYRKRQHTGTPRKVYTWRTEVKDGFIKVYDLKRVK